MSVRKCWNEPREPVPVEAPFDRVTFTETRGPRRTQRTGGERGGEQVKLVAQRDVFFFFVHCSRCSATPSPPPPASTDRAEPILRRVTLTHAHTHTPPSYVNTRLCTGVREMDR